MSIQNVARGAAMAALYLAVPAAALAGKGWEVEYHSNAAADQPGSFILKMDDENIRLTPVGEEAEVIITPEGFLVVNHESHENMAMRFEDLETAMSGISEAMKQAQAQLDEAKKNMSPEQIEAMEKYMPKFEGPGAAAAGVERKYSFKRTKEKGEVAGLSTVKADVYEDGEVVGEVWLTSKIPVETLVRSSERMIQSLPPEMGGNLGLAEMFVGIEGFPLKMVNRKEDPHEVIEAVRAAEKKFGDDTWKGPSEYKTISMADRMKFEMNEDRE